MALAAALDAALAAALAVALAFFASPAATLASRASCPDSLCFLRLSIVCVTPVDTTASPVLVAKGTLVSTAAWTARSVQCELLGNALIRALSWSRSHSPRSPMAPKSPPSSTHNLRYLTTFSSWKTA